MVWENFVEPVASESADRQVDLRFPHQLAVLHDPGHETGEHQAHGCFGVDTRLAVVLTVAVRDVLADPSEIQTPVDPACLLNPGNSGSKCTAKDDQHQQYPVAPLTAKLADIAGQPEPVP